MHGLPTSIESKSIRSLKKNKISYLTCHKNVWHGCRDMMNFAIFRVTNKEYELAQECYSCIIGFGSNVLRGLMELLVHVQYMGYGCKSFSPIFKDKYTLTIIFGAWTQCYSLRWRN